MDSWKPRYLVETPASIKQGGIRFPKGLGAAVICVYGTEKPSRTLGYVTTTDIAKQIADYLNESTAVNEKLGFVPKCGEPACNHQQRLFGINIIANPCSDCGNIPGVRGSKKFSSALKQPPQPWPPAPGGGGDGPFPKDAVLPDVEVFHMGSQGVEVRYNGKGLPTPPDAVYMNEAGVQRNIKALAGRLLTVLDATFADPVQREAMKSVVRREVRTQLNRVAAFFCQRPSANDDEEEAMSQDV